MFKREKITAIFIILAAAAFVLLAPRTVSAATVDVEEGTYTFYSGVGGSMVLDVYAGSTANKANIQIYTSNNTLAQEFQVTRVGDYYSIINAKSGKAVDVYGGKKTNKANIWQYTWNGSNAQLWDFVDAGGGFYYIRNVGSGKVLDVWGGKAANKTNVWQYTLNNTAAQKWKLVPIETEQNADLPVDVEMNIRSAVDTSYVLDIYGGSKAKGANVQLYKENGSAAQSFVFIDVNGYYLIYNVNSDLVLDVWGGKAKNKTNVDQYIENGTAAQMWKAVANEDGSVTFKSAINENYALDLYGGKVGNKKNIQIYTANGSAAQRWYLTEVYTPAVDYIANKNSGIFHISTCDSVSRMSEANKVFYSSREDAINDGYRPCENCNP